MTMASEGGGKLTNIVKVRYGSSRSEFYSDYALLFTARPPWGKLDLFEEESLDSIEVSFDEMEYVKHGDYELYSYNLSCFFDCVYGWLKPGRYVKVITDGCRVDSLMDNFKISKYPRFNRSIREVEMFELLGIKSKDCRN